MYTFPDLKWHTGSGPVVYIPSYCIKDKIYSVYATGCRTLLQTLYANSTWLSIAPGLSIFLNQCVSRMYCKATFQMAFTLVVVPCLPTYSIQVSSLLGRGASTLHQEIWDHCKIPTSITLFTQGHHLKAHAMHMLPKCCYPVFLPRTLQS